MINALVKAHDEADFGAVDVAEPRDDGLVHEQAAHRLLGGVQLLPEALLVSVLAQRVGAQLGRLRLVERCRRGFKSKVELFIDASTDADEA